MSLRNRIKHDNSKVVAGRITSLQVQNNNYSDFAERIEKLADALERSLVVEGITQTKAHEMAVEQTVQTCRANVKSDLVKTILASTKFSDPKDVVAKLIIEQAYEKQEKQVLKIGNFNRQNSVTLHNRRNFSNNSSFRNNRNNYFQYTRNNGFNNDSNRNNFQYSHNNNSRNGHNDFRNHNNNNNFSNRNFNNNRVTHESPRNNNFNNNNYSDRNQVSVRTLNGQSHQEVEQAAEEA